MPLDGWDYVHRPRIPAPGTEADIVSSDGSLQLDLGGWGYVAALPNGTFQTACGSVQPGPGTLSSYRTEAYGLLAPMRDLYADHHHRTVHHYLDNLAVVKVANGLKFPAVAAADVWDEIRYWQARWGARYQVHWTKGHPEKVKPQRASWTHQDWGDHVADGLADLGRTLGTGDLRDTFTHGRPLASMCRRCPLL